MKLERYFTNFVINDKKTTLNRYHKRLDLHDITWYLNYEIKID